MEKVLCPKCGKNHVDQAYEDGRVEHAMLLLALAMTENRVIAVPMIDAATNQPGWTLAVRLVDSEDFVQLAVFIPGSDMTRYIPDAAEAQGYTNIDESTGVVSDVKVH